MAIWGKKKSKGSDEEEPEETSAGKTEEQGRKKKKKKPNERLDSVISESVVSSAVDILQRNEAFALPDGESWVIMLLDAEAIGGLGKKYSNDEAKGSIIELINADQIKVLSTEVMLEEDYLGIIPTEDTLERMEEYSLLTEAPYYWATVVLTDDGNDLDVTPVAEATYADAAMVSSGQDSIAQRLPEIWAWGGGDQLEEEPEPEPEPQYEEPAEEEYVAEEDPMSGADAGDDGVDYESMDADDQQYQTDEDESFGDEFVSEPAEAETYPVDEAAQQGVVEDYPEPETEEVDDDYLAHLEYLEQNDDRVVSEDEVQSAIARRFLSDDLELKIELDEFDTTFATEAPAIVFPEADGTTDWLGSHVNQLVRQANAELKRLHQDNVNELREMYVSLLSEHVETVMKQVSISEGDTVFQRMHETAESQYAQLTSSVEEEAAARRKELTQQFEEAADARAAAAASHVRADYQKRNRPRLEQQIAEVPFELQRRHEERHQYQKQEVLSWRESEAKKRMALGATRAMEIVAQRQVEQRENEMEIMRGWSDELTRFIDQNRKNDIARAQALADQLSKENQIEQLRTDYSQQIAELTADREARIKSLEAEIQRNHEAATRELESRESALQSQVEIQAQKAEASEATVKRLTDQMGDLDENLRQQYEDRIRQLSETNEKRGDDLKWNEQLQKRQTLMLTLMMVVFTIMALGVGVVAGWAISGNNDAPQTEPAPQYQQQPQPQQP